MTIAIRQKVTIKPGGRIEIRSSKLTPGNTADVIVLLYTCDGANKKSMTTSSLIQSGLFGLWKDREDIKDSLTYARQLRRKAERRSR